MKKYRKRFSLVFLSLFVIAVMFAAAGCSRNTSSDPDPSSAPSDQSTDPVSPDGSEPTGIDDRQSSAADEQGSDSAEIPPEAPKDEAARQKNAQAAADLASKLGSSETKTVTLSGDVYIREPIHVYGTKTVKGGGRIIMELDADQYQHMLDVHSGAELILDGGTIDGNAAGSCILVESGAKLTMLSGTVTYGCPYGVEVVGSAEVKGGIISESIGAAMYIRSNASATVTGGKITKNAYLGIKTERDGSVKISDGAEITRCGYCLVYNNGKCEITGGTMHEGGAYIAYNMGDMTVSGSKTLEWYGASVHAISQGKTGTLLVDGLYFHDTGWHGISSTPGTSQMTLKNIECENIAQAAFYLRTGAKLENIKVRNCGTAGVYVGNGSTVDIAGLSVEGSGGRGLWNFGGTVTASDVVIRSSKDFGVTSTFFDGKNGSVTIKGLIVEGTEKDNAVSANESTINISDGRISGSASNGVIAMKGAKVNLTDVEFSGNKNYAVVATDPGSKITMKGVSIDGDKRGIISYHGTITGNDISISNTAEYSVTSSYSDSVIDLGNLRIDGCKGQAAVNVGGTKTTLRNAVITGSVKNGIDVNENGTLTAEKVTVKEPGGVGINIIGAQVDGSDITIEKAGNYAIYSQKEKNVTGRTVINGLKIDGTVNQAVSCNATVVELSDVTIDNAGTSGTPKCALYVIKGGRLTAKNAEISNTAYTAVYVEDGGARASLDNVRISGGERGIVCYSGRVEGSDVTVSDTASFAITSSRTDSVIDLTGVRVNGCKHDGGGAVNCGGAKITLTDLTIDGAAGHGMNVDGGGILTVKNGTVKNVSKWCGVYVNGGTFDANDLTIEAPNYNGIEVLGGGTASAEKLSVTAPGHNGVLVTDGSFTGKDVTVSDSVWHGVHVQSAGSAQINGAVLKDTALNGIFNEDGITSGSNITVDSKSHGVAASGGRVTLTALTVNTAEKQGVNIYNSAQVKLDALTIASAGIHGINLEKGSSLELDTADISNIATYNGIYVNGGTLTGKAVTVTAPKYNGLEVLNDGAATLDGFTVSGAPHNGALVAKGTFEAKNVNISGCSYHGIDVEAEGILKLTDAELTGNTLNPVFVNGGTMTGGGITVTSAAHGLAIAGGNAEIDGYTVKDAKSQGVNIYNNATAKIANLTVEKAGIHGINLEKGSSLELDTAAISNIATYNGIYVNGGTLTGKAVTVTAPKYNGLEVLNDGAATLDGFTATGAPRNGALVTKGTFEVKNAALSGNSYHGIDVAAGGVLNISDSSITGNTLNAINTAGTVTGSNIVMNTLPYYGINASAGTISITGLEIKGAARHAINLNGTVTAELTGADIDTTGWEGIGLYNTASLKLTDSCIVNWKTSAVKQAGTGTYTPVNVTVN